MISLQSANLKEDDILPLGIWIKSLGPWLPAESVDRQWGLETSGRFHQKKVAKMTFGLFFRTGRMIRNADSIK